MSIGQAGVGPKSLSPATLELLANPKTLEKTLASLQSAQDEAKKAIALAGPATEILQIRADIEVTLADAEAVHNKAVEDAAALVEKAETQAQLIVDKARVLGVEAAEESAKEIAEKNKILDERETSIAAVELRNAEGHAAVRQAQEDLQTQADEVAVQRGVIDARAAELETLSDSLLKEKTRLTGISEQLASALR